MADVDETTSYDAQQVVEDIKSGEQEEPEVNVEKSYAESKKFAFSDHTPDEVKTSGTEDDPAPRFSMATLGESKAGSGEGITTGDPDEFLGMAQEIQQD